jgi:hypothetical protein
VSALIDRLRRRPPAPRLQPAKLRAIDAAFADGEARSFADLGGVWAVDGGYAFHALERHGAERAVLVDEHLSEAVRERARGFPALELVEGDFGDPAVAERVGEVDAVLLFDVLLHQVAPDWDEVLAAYARRARRLVVVQPQYVAGAATVRLPDLGRERYLELVPDLPLHHALFERPELRDAHEVWQWGITDADLRARAADLGFELAHFENAGTWQDREAFETHAFVFRRREP